MNACRQPLGDNMNVLKAQVGDRWISILHYGDGPVYLFYIILPKREEQVLGSYLPQDDYPQLVLVNFHLGYIAGLWMMIEFLYDYDDLDDAVVLLLISYNNDEL